MSDTVLGATNLSVSLCGVVWRVRIVITKVKGKLCQATLNVVIMSYMKAFLLMGRRVYLEFNRQ